MNEHRSHFGRIRRIHFVGIGGTGMSGIAEVLLSLGYEVRGSDLAATAVTRRLEELGAVVHQGHDPEHLGDAQVVVVSTAVPEDNPEVQRARQSGVPVIPRAEMLAELMRMQRGIAVAGSHGKTTTTSLLAHVLAEADLDPTVIVGGRLNVLGSGGRLGSGRLLVCEADESDGSFLRLTPTIAIATNIDDEHLGAYGGNLHRLREAFADFLNKVPFYGVAVVCLDDPALQDLLPRLDRPVVSYGFSAQADIQGAAPAFDRFGSRMQVEIRGEARGEVELPLPGRYACQNALAAIAVADHLRVPFETVREALAGFEGTGRRFERKGEAGGILVVDDYAHHPTEIRATLEAARGGFPDRRVVAVFQPHRYSRTRDCMGEFHRCFYDADLLLVTDLYPAGEEPIPGIDAASLHRGIQEHGHRQSFYTNGLDTTLERLAELAEPGDLVLTLGAGDVHTVGTRLLERLGEGGS